MKHRFLRLLVFTGLPLLYAFHWPWQPADVSNRIELSGTVEAREVDLAFQVGGRIVRLAVDEGDAVQVGQPVASLDENDYQLALRNATAQRDAAQAALAVLQAGTRVQELRVAEAQLAKAQADFDYARLEYQRVAELIPKRLAAQERLDQARLQQEVAQAGIEQARQNLALLREGPRQEELDRAVAELRARQVAVEIAQRQLEYAQLHSPVAGVVSVRLAEAGEVVVVGKPVLRVAELGRPWVRAYLNEVDLARVRLGQPAEVRVDGLPGQVFNGRLAFIAPDAEFTPKTVETRALRVDLVYRIKVEVDNPAGVLKLGMPADVALKAVAP
ncbi:MAG TPA: efflux RND transporter periplasmic adaptor subunit [Candidatus Competibacteraceae bacterium]|nr:efflux RND transporter periplasmic adaptor subunit [Candidatus Competibacteraceae bacterium]HRZ05223.1 efflux RND transporter periplasmic adaptor subunit [Candidatus Competibacteraceae bacterium]HSA45126.1 efflux RND transporter periplasmic adaptor subunit [Candidatus Competibacteraceae bacterium]